MENVYQSMKSFALEQRSQMISFLKNVNVEDDCHATVHFIMKRYAEENELLISDFTTKSEDLDYEYYTVDVESLPINLLNIIYNFLRLHFKKDV